jgi:chromosome transmission fidelity protein 4
MVGSFNWLTKAGEQNLGFTLLDTRTMTCIVTDVGLPLSPSSTLDWIGFSEDSLPATYDSSGVLRVFYQSWIPILDTRVALSSSKNEHYWAVGLTDNKFMMVICKVT